MTDTKPASTPMTREELLLLPVEQQRVEIARDVLALMEANKISATHGSYMNSELPWEKLLSIEEQATLFRDFFNDNAIITEKDANDETYSFPSCEVCAIGAVFIAAVDKFNSLSCSDLDLTDPSDEEMVPYLKPWFSRYQLRLIEAAFEAKWCAGTHTRPESEKGRLEVLRAEGFGHDPEIGRNPMGEARMKKIMLNIIANNGTFVP